MSENREKSKEDKKPEVGEKTEMTKDVEMAVFESDGKGAKDSETKKFSYTEELVSIDALFATRKTQQRSINALRERVRHNLLIYVKSDGPTQLFDKQVSLYLLQAAVRCKGPRVTWGNIGNASRRSGINKERIIDIIAQSTNPQAVVKTLEDEIRQNL